MNSKNQSEPWRVGADRRIWAIAGPAILANSSAPLVGLVDAWALGHLPSSVHLAAVGVGATIFTYIFWAFGFLRMGTTGFVAQAHGRRDVGALVRLMLRVSLTSLIIAAFILLLRSPLYTIAVQILAPPDSVREMLASYFDLRVWSAPATLLFYGINGFLIGTARTKTALWLHLLLNVTNGVLNLVFVIGMGMGVAGVALGTLIAEWLTAGVGTLLIIRYLGAANLQTALFERATWQLAKYLELFRVNGLLLLRTILLITALSLVMREAGKIGTTAVAASHIANTFLMLISLGLDGFAYAGEAMAGAAWGRGDRAEFRFQVIRSSLWAAGASLVYALLFLLAGDTITAILTDLPDVRATTAAIMPVLVMLPIVGFACYQFDGIYIGATSAGYMLITMAIATAVYIAILPVMSETWGITGLWSAVLIFMGLRGLAQLICYPLLEQKIPVVHETTP